MIGVVDETSYVKKGDETACVQRQYCGASGKIDNCVVSENLGYTDGNIHVLLDQELYVPQSWEEDAKKREKAGIPATVRYRPYWEIALEQIRRARGNGIQFDWMTGDERYGEVPAFLSKLEEMGQRYVMEIPKNVTGWCRRPVVIEEEFRDEGERGRPRNMPRMADGTKAAQAVNRLVLTSKVFRQQEWTTYRVKDSQRGPEVWRVKVGVFYQHRDGLPSKALRLMMAESMLTGEIKYFLSDAAGDVPVETLLRVAFSRWRIERCFEDYKSELGMDHFEVRKWTAIRRHFAVSLVSGLFLETECMRIRKKKSVDIRLPDSQGIQRPDRNDSVYAPEAVEAAEPGGRGDSGNPKTQRRSLALAPSRTAERITSSRNFTDATTALRSRQKVALSC